MKIKLTEFSLKHFNEKNVGTKILDISPEKFEHTINNLYDVENLLKDSDYADFCKYLVINNFTDAKSGSMRITEENKKFLKSGYSAREEGELPILSRWFEFDSKEDIPNAEKLVIILYSKEQLELEHLEKNPSIDNFEFNGVDCDYGVVAILGQQTEEADPIKPITMMRNHLGKSFGGSGVEIDEKKYLESVEFWSNHSVVL